MPGDGSYPTLQSGRSPDWNVHVPLSSRHVTKIRPMPPELKAVADLTNTARYDAQMALRFPPEYIQEVCIFVTQLHDVAEWVSFFDHIACDLTGMPLFIGEIQEPGLKMSFDTFAAIFVQGARTIPESTFAMIPFFAFLNRKMASENAN
jgi:hypothetical protein